MLATFGVGQVILSMLFFFLLFVWIMLVFRIFADLFRSQDLSGIAKVLWVVFILVFNYLGVFAYIIVRGNKMAENEVKAMQAQEQAARSYIQEAAGSKSPADELHRLVELRDKGVIDEAEFAKLKAKIVG